MNLLNLRLIASLVGLVLLMSGCGPRRFPWPLTKRSAAPITNVEVQTLSPDYDRTRSRVLVRRVARSTRANLDWAAYNKNVVTWDPKDPLSTGAKGWVQAKVFGDVLVVDSIVAAIDQTGLTPAEQKQPFAFSPMVDFLSQWNYEKSSGLEDARAAVRTFSWGLPPNVQLTYQEITAAWLHRPASGDSVQLWVKIEFQPWAHLFSDFPDEDRDGFPEVYAQLKPGLLTTQALEKLEQDYLNKTLDSSEVKAWANEFASYWYPSYNTDVVGMGASPTWPLSDTEPKVLAELKGKTFAAPAVVIRAKPHGEAIYNVFLVAGLETKPAPTSSGVTRSGPAGARLLSPEPETLIATIEDELKRLGQGSWNKWAAATKPWRTKIRSRLKARPKALKALIGKDGFLFFRNSLTYVVGGDVQQQPAGKNPFKTIVDFKEYLASMKVDFLLVPIPTKAEVFPDKLLNLVRSDKNIPVLNPHGRKFLLELGQAGVDVVDLLPTFLEARLQTKADQEALYQAQDTHWTNRGLKLAAALLAKRIQRYPWFEGLAEKTIKYRIEQVVFKRHGDLVSRLADAEQLKYKPTSLIGHRVIGPDGKAYDDDPTSPIAILGDSFTGVFQRTDCRNAGVSAHLARELGQPVDLVMSYGGGPNVRRKLMRRGEEDLSKKRLVIWMFAARDFYDYWEDWEQLKRTK